MIYVVQTFLSGFARLHHREVPLQPHALPIRSAVATGRVKIRRSLRRKQQRCGTAAGAPRDLSLPHSPRMGEAALQQPGNGECRLTPLCNWSEWADRRMNAALRTRQSRQGRPDMTADTLTAAVLPKPPSMHRLIIAATIGHLVAWVAFVVS